MGKYLGLPRNNILSNDAEDDQNYLCAAILCWFLSQILTVSLKFACINSSLE